VLVITFSAFIVISHDAHTTATIKQVVFQPKTVKKSLSAEALS
jgi:hypothetical protein